MLTTQACNGNHEMGIISSVPWSFSAIKSIVGSNSWPKNRTSNERNTGHLLVKRSVDLPGGGGRVAWTREKFQASRQWFLYPSRADNHIVSFLHQLFKVVKIACGQGPLDMSFMEVAQMLSVEVEMEVDSMAGKKVTQRKGEYSRMLQRMAYQGCGRAVSVQAAMGQECEAGRPSSGSPEKKPHKSQVGTRMNNHGFITRCLYRI